MFNMYRLTLILGICFLSNGVVSEAEMKKPTILISILIRNKASALPYFLTYLEKLDYPTDRISLWIRSDHNIDNSFDIVNTWLRSVNNTYHSIHAELIADKEVYAGETSPAHWTEERFSHMIKLRESALDYGRRLWADYVLAIDADVFLTNPDTLNLLIHKNYTVVAPMLTSEGLYSNFWHGWTEDYYYLRTDGYKPILFRKEIGCFDVPMVHSCVLINLRHAESDLLTYVPEKIENFDGPRDDIITFAISAYKNHIPMYVCNEITYGFVTVPLQQTDDLNVDRTVLTNLKLEALNEIGQTLTAKELFNTYLTVPKKDTLGFDKIFMINLLRRPERRRKMLTAFDELGLDVDILDAVDGREINSTILNQLEFLPEFLDPYKKRPMTLGEIGCFLSHYRIWQEMVKMGYNRVLILEDDLKFQPFFRAKALQVMKEADKYGPWDLVYFGRKPLGEEEEQWVNGARYLVFPDFSYWTLGYVLSQQGAQKLLDPNPLKKLVPVDEYLPIMFDKHPQDSWKSHFPKRNLIAFSAAPLLVYPTRYVGDEGYISDTEDSNVITL